MKYSVEFKQSAVQKLLRRGQRTVLEITEELGVARPTLYQWRKELASVGDMKKSTSPKDRPGHEKLKVLIEYGALPLEKRGEYLRRNGLHEDNLHEWSAQIEKAFLPLKKSLQERQELGVQIEKVKKLEKELQRKDKALAEVSALLILKKKADLIWGSGEDE